MYPSTLARILAGTAVMCAGLGAASIELSRPEARKALRILEAAPIRFEAADARARAFTARGIGYQLQVTPQGATFLLPASAGSTREMRLSISGSEPGAAMRAESPLAMTTNYFVGTRSDWRAGVRSYRRVRATGVYPGIDLVYYGSGGRLEYDFVVSPGADPDRIRLRFSGADHLRLNPTGELELQGGGASLVARPPDVYQTIEGRRVRVAGKYRLGPDSEVAFALGKYDRSRPLVIDPVVAYTGYVRDNVNDLVVGVGADAEGFLYVAGTTTSADFVSTEGAFQTTKPGTTDVFVAKLDPNASGDASVVYSTYLGGTNNDELKAMAVDSIGNVYLAGVTNSTDFLFSGNAYQATLVGNTDAFVAKVRPYVYGSDGLEYASLIGGVSDETAWAVAYDAQGRIYAAGSTNSYDFPLLGDPFQGGWAGGSDGFVTVFEPWQEKELSAVYSTYLGGGANDTAKAIAVNADGIIAVAGATNSGDFPLQRAYQTYIAGRTDAFVTKLDRTLGSGVLLGSTILGGAQPDEARQVLFDRTGGIVVVGYTLSANFPTTDNAPQPRLAGDVDLFVSRVDFSRTGLDALTYSTLFGGSGPDVVFGACFDSQGLLYLTGYTLSDDFPLAGQPLQYYRLPAADGFVSILDLGRSGSRALVWSTYLGTGGNDVLQGIVIDAAGRIVVSGVSAAAAFPAGNPVGRNTPAGAYAPVVSVIDLKADPGQ